jgi:hypothetical protein
MDKLFTGFEYAFFFIWFISGTARNKLRAAPSHSQILSKKLMNHLSFMAQVIVLPILVSFGRLLLTVHEFLQPLPHFEPHTAARPFDNLQDLHVPF